MKVIFGIILLVLGLFFAYQGYEMKQTASAKIEREISSAVKFFSNDRGGVKENVNDEANIKLIGGGIGALLGLSLMIYGVTNKRQNSNNNKNV